MKKVRERIYEIINFVNAVSHCLHLMTRLVADIAASCVMSHYCALHGGALVLSVWDEVKEKKAGVKCSPAFSWSRTGLSRMRS